MPFATGSKQLINSSSCTDLLFIQSFKVFGLLEDNPEQSVLYEEFTRQLFFPTHPIPLFCSFIYFEKSKKKKGIVSQTNKSSVAEKER